MLLLGAGGVGCAAARILARRSFAEAVVIGDYDLFRAEAAAASTRDLRFSAAQVDASNQRAVEATISEHRIDAVVGVTDPRSTMPTFRAALACRTLYIDMAISSSKPHPVHPYRETGVKLGDEQFALAEEWAQGGQLALLGMGVEAGLADVFARYASDHLFDEIDEAGVRDAANLNINGRDIAPVHGMWTAIDECLSPPVVFERDRGWFTTEPFSEAEIFDFPEGIGPIECVNVEHEEVLLIPRWVEAKRVTFKYGLGAEFVSTLRTLRKLGLDRREPVVVNGVLVSPRDVVAACLPDPAGLGKLARGKTCSGLWVRGTGKDGRPRSTYLYRAVDNEWSLQEYGAQAANWQTAVNPIVALELISSGLWSGVGVLGPEAFDAVPFLTLLAKDYESPWRLQEIPA
ncbi:saccharopine dehydrogenase-like NADP-dependent oxidoreductase [Jatrophihabitans sp. GAS493]|nr:saccharopine dehydrogenase-like NADP-dependent oxidoreductase [Jatrophihabitans sp. GAS493]